jgi:hypothetical protein
MIGGEHVPFSTARRVVDRMRHGVGMDDHRKSGDIFSNSQIQMHLTGKRLRVHLGKALQLCATGPRRQRHPMEGRARMPIGSVASPSLRNGRKLS